MSVILTVVGTAEDPSQMHTSKGSPAGTHGVKTRVLVKLVALWYSDLACEVVCSSTALNPIATSTKFTLLGYGSV